jgi:hypothetical protein
LDSTEVLSYSRRAAAFASFDLNCHLTREWVAALSIDQNVQAYDISAERNLIFVTQNVFSNDKIVRNLQFAVDAANGKLLPIFPDPVSTTPSVGAHVIAGAQYADTGQGVCGLHGEIWDRTVECFAVDTSVLVGETKGWSHPTIRTALKASRVVISDYRRKLDWIDLFWYPGSVRRRVVWDFRSGKELVKWTPKTQNLFTDAGPYATAPQSQPHQFDISPDGGYIVEGGAGVVSLYKIEP